MGTRPRRRASFALVIGIAVLLGVGGCSSTQTRGCDEAGKLSEQGHLAKALDAYKAAARAGEGSCAEDGANSVLDRQRDALGGVADGKAAEAAGDKPAAQAAYLAVLDRDVDNTDAAAGLNRLNRATTAAGPSGKPAVTPSPTPTSTRPSTRPSMGTASDASESSPGGGDRFLLVVVTAVVLVSTALTVWDRFGPEREREKRDAVPDTSPTAADRDRDAQFERVVSLLEQNQEYLRRLLPPTRTRLEHDEATWTDLAAELIRAGWPLEDGAGDGATGSGGGDRTSAGQSLVAAGVVRRSTVISSGGFVYVRQESIALGAMAADRHHLPQLAEEFLHAVATGKASLREGLLPGLSEAAASAFVKGAVDPQWPTVVTWWRTKEPFPLGAGADRLGGPGGAQDVVHELVAGLPVRSLLDAVDVPLPVAQLAGRVAGEIELPGDYALGGARLLLQVTGIVIGTALGVPLVANAATRSLAYDVVREVFTSALLSTAAPAERETPAGAQPAADLRRPPRPGTVDSPTVGTRASSSDRPPPGAARLSELFSGDAPASPAAAPRPRPPGLRRLRAEVDSVPVRRSEMDGVPAPSELTAEDRTRPAEVKGPQAHRDGPGAGMGGR